MKRNHRSHSGLNFWPSFTDAITAIFICVTFFLVVMVIKNYVDLSRLRTLEELVGKIEKDLDELEEFMGGGRRRRGRGYYCDAQLYFVLFR